MLHHATWCPPDSNYRSRSHSSAAHICRVLNLFCREKLCLGMTAVFKLLHKQREQAIYWAKCSLKHRKMMMA